MLVVAPIIGLSLQIAYASSFNESQMEIYFWMYTLASIFNFFYQFLIYIPIMNRKLETFMDRIKYPITWYKEEKEKPDPLSVNREELSEEDKREYDKQLAKRDSRMMYTNQKREAGSGKRRLDTHVLITEDIYSMFFVSNLYADYIYFWQKVAEQKARYEVIDPADPDAEMNEKIDKFVRQSYNRERVEVDLKKLRISLDYYRVVLLAEMLGVWFI